MSRPITISIPKPCHENWQEMTATERGAFCKSCQKEVIDFTKKTEDETHRILSGGGATCGRFRTDQLERPIYQTTYIKSWWHWKAIAASVLSLLSFKSSRANYKDIADIAVLKSDTFSSINDSTVVFQANTIYPATVISGRVINFANQGLPESKIELLDSAQLVLVSIETDSSGSFSISVDSSVLQPCRYIRASSGTYNHIIEEFSTDSTTNLELLLSKLTFTWDTNFKPTNIEVVYSLQHDVSGYCAITIEDPFPLEQTIWTKLNPLKIFAGRSITTHSKKQELLDQKKDYPNPNDKPHHNNKPNSEAAIPTQTLIRTESKRKKATK